MVEMLLGWSSTYIIFISFINSTWQLHIGQLRFLILAEVPKIFFKSTCVMELLHGTNVYYMIFKKCVFLLLSRLEMAANTGHCSNIEPYVDMQKFISQ